MKQLLSDTQRETLFGAIEEEINDKARWLQIISESGGELQFVTLVIQQNPETAECWDLVAILSVDEEFELSDDARAQVVDHLEEIADSLYKEFEEAGLSNDLMADYRIEIDALN